MATFQIKTVSTFSSLPEQITDAALSPYKTRQDKMNNAVFIALFSILTATQACCFDPDVCDVIRVESWSEKYAKKVVEDASYVLNMTVVDRQSAAECNLGESFGYQKNNLWVDHGCRADFKVCYLPVSPIRCRVVKAESWSYKYAETYVVDAALFINMTIEDQQSAASCDLDKTFGFYNQNSTVWVNNGCRADFNVCFVYGITRITTINVSSWNFKYSTQILNTLPSATCIYSMQVANQQSTAPCTLGTTFGFMANTMWVRDGCRADFTVNYYIV
ncbi:lectin ADEL [Aplysia californica]|uniref:Lectin ADEL n=1 Tax=Aplysia californica TaxID=6500 RepID=A0ABM0JE47_APLCA|nr:lectin ADEL [Aplysia californica]